MKISYNWLLDYLSVKPSVEEIADILTAVGLEVEGVEKYETLKGGLQGLVVGHVLEVEKHPDADRLRITKTEVGNGEVLQIVCGAANVAAGQKVVVATHGTVLYPAQGDPILIKKSKIRGVESQGMICAEDEIGLSNNHEGILVLDSSLPTGTPLHEVFKVYSDFTIEVNITPNRGDAMSHIGMARDIACWYAFHKNQKDVFRLPQSKAIAASLKNPYEVVIENSEACKRYCGLYIKGVEVKDSPEWMQNRLKSIGLKPINNIVDLTNFLLYEYGQPLHAFDADKIIGKQVIVKNLPSETPFTTLDNKVIKLSNEDLMICDERGGLCIAGVYGGLESGVTTNTKNIFLESAWFHPVSIRRTAVRYQLRTDAAMRFEKQVNMNNTANVLMRAFELIQQISTVQAVSDITEHYPGNTNARSVKLRYTYLNDLCGFDIEPQKANTILSNLGFEKVSADEVSSIWQIPGYKNDCTIEEDLVEEVIRIIGYDAIPLKTSLKSSLTYSNEDSRREQFYRKLQKVLSGLGFNEVNNNSIFSAQQTEKLLPQQSQEIVRLLSYSNSGLDSLRTSIVMPLLNTVCFNINRREIDLKLFELGKTYQYINGQYVEQNKVAILITGKAEAEGWRSNSGLADLYTIKGYVRAMLTQLGILNYQISETDHNAFDYAIRYQVKNKTVAIAGSVSASWLKEFDIKQEVYYAELDTDMLFQYQSSSVKHREPSRFPAMRRDLALLLPDSITYNEIEKLAIKHGGALLRDVNLFDVYKDKKLGEGIKSYAVSFTFMDDTKTLVDAVVDEQMLILRSVFEKELNAHIRS